MGPLLFCIFIYINDLVHSIKFAKILICTDDVKIFSTIQSLEDAKRLQSDLDALTVWSNEKKVKNRYEKQII